MKNPMFGESVSDALTVHHPTLQYRSLLFSLIFLAFRSIVPRPIMFVEFVHQHDSDRKYSADK